MGRNEEGRCSTVPENGDSTQNRALRLTVLNAMCSLDLAIRIYTVAIAVGLGVAKVSL